MSNQNQSISELKTLNKNTLSGEDLIAVVDVSENSSPSGETKKISVNQLIEHIAAAVISRINGA
jgi:hypothetical protein